jgi:hypothetical protein
MIRHLDQGFRRYPLPFPPGKSASGWSDRLLSVCGNAPSEKEERKGQRDPRRLNGPRPDTVRSETAGAVDFAG